MLLGRIELIISLLDFFYDLIDKMEMCELRLYLLLSLL